MRGQEEIIETQNVSEVGQNVAVPCDQPAQGKDSAHLGPVNQRKQDLHIKSNLCFLITSVNNLITFNLTVFSRLDGYANLNEISTSRYP